MNDGTPIRQARNVELGASGEEFQNLHEFAQKARARLNQNAGDYIVGASETETTMRRNRMALDEIAFRPRVLRNVINVDPSTEVFGRKLRLPVMIAPVGALEIFDPDAGAAVARGAGTFASSGAAGRGAFLGRGVRIRTLAAVLARGLLESSGARIQCGEWVRKFLRTSGAHDRLSDSC